MAVGSAVLAARDMYPEVFAVGGLENELVIISVVLQPIKPLAGGLKVGMTLVIIPSGIACERQTDVSSFAQGVLGGIGSTNLHVELVATVAGGDDNGATNEPAERFQNFLAELLEYRYKPRWYTVINATS